LSIIVSAGRIERTASSAANVSSSTSGQRHACPYRVVLRVGALDRAAELLDSEQQVVADGGADVDLDRAVARHVEARPEVGKGAEQRVAAVPLRLQDQL
jgi:hypothetical protein